MRKLWLVCLASLAGAACGSSEAPSCGDCALDPEMACFQYSGAPLACVKKCKSGCEAGHECVQQGGEELCSPFCDSAKCSDAGLAACSSPCGRCTPVPCSSSRPCSSPGEFCDIGNICRKVSGQCLTSSDCRTPAIAIVLSNENACWPETAMITYGHASCDDGWCRLRQMPVAMTFLHTEALLSPPLPSSTEASDGTNDIQFSWQGFEDPFIAMVLGSIPKTQEALLSSAIWGASFPSGQRGYIKWSEGMAIDQGAWKGRPTPPPTDRTLYFLLQAVRDGVLMARSEPVPFVVGPQWPTPGDACVDMESVPDGCHNPGKAPQVCYEGRCFIACASDADCPAGIKCGVPLAKGGIFRLCGL